MKLNNYKAFAGFHYLQSLICENIMEVLKLTEIRNLLNNLNIDDYPDTYDPFNDPNSDDKIMSTPSQTLILIVNSALREHPSADMGS